MGLGFGLGSGLGLGSESGIGSTPTLTLTLALTPNQVGKNGLGVLWNLCDSDDHWSAFLQEGPAMVAVLLGTMQQHPSNKAIEESVIDMLW